MRRLEEKKKKTKGFLISKELQKDKGEQKKIRDLQYDNV